MIVDLVGPHGYIHGWIFVGIPAAGQEVYHPGHGRGTVTASGGGRVAVSFDAGHSKSFPVRSHQGPGHFEQMTDDELAAEYGRSQGSRAEAVIAEADRRDQRDQDAQAQAKSRRISALYAEKPKTEADRDRVYQGLISEGEDPEGAWAHAHGTNTEAMRKQSVIADLRAQGYKGAGFDSLTRDAFKDEIRRRTISAEGATNGYMLGPAGKKAGIDPWSLFTGPESRARKYASPELKEWFDQNGRPTVADFQASLMGQKAGMKPADFYASVTWDDLAAVIELAPRAPEDNPVTVTAQAPAASRRSRQVPLTPMRQDAAKLMRKLAASVQQSHPDMNVHDHLRDAAKQVEKGNEEGAQRHLRAAMFSLTPQSLMRNGQHTDESHQAARSAMHSVHRHLLLVKDIADADARNQRAIARDSGDGAAAPQKQADPNAGYGPGANAQKPTVRQPPGDQALNAPAKADGGGSDPSVADPDAPQRPGSKQFAHWGEVGRALELTGKGGWNHGWEYVGGPGLPSVAEHRAARNAARRKNAPAAGKPTAKAAAPAKEAGAPDGRSLADRLNMTGANAGKRAQKQAVKALPAAHLKAMDAEYARRASLLGQHGKVSPTHKIVRDEIASRARGATVQTAYDWRDLLNLIDLSAKTAALERTPAPIGKPGGPGLYHVKGLGHAAYFEQVRNGLMKRGVAEGAAHAMTWSILRRWAAGGGKVHPEVQAAAQKAIAEEEAKAHSHAVTWDDVARVFDFGFNPAEARVPAGSATAGQFSAGGGAAASGQQQANGKQPPPQTPAQKAAAVAAAKHKAHVAHVAHVNGVSSKKAELMVTAQDDRQKAAGLIKQRDALAKALASASGKTSTGQAGATTAKTATTKTTAPATASTTAATTASTKTASTATAAKSATAAAAPKPGSAAAIKAQIGQLNVQINNLLAQAKQAETQAATMK